MTDTRTLTAADVAAVLNALNRVARAVWRIHGHPGSIDGFDIGDGLAINGSHHHHGDDDRYEELIPLALIAQELAGEDWQTGYREALERWRRKRAEEEARLEAEQEARAQATKESRERAEYDRLRAIYGEAS